MSDIWDPEAPRSPSPSAKRSRRADKLVTLEAMKMLTTVSAGTDRTVSEVLVIKGDAVDSDDLLVVLTAE